MSAKFNIRELEYRRALTVQQAAFYAATSRDVILRWLNSGKLGYYVLPKTSSKKIQRRILREELDKFLESQYRKTTPHRKQYSSDIVNSRKPRLELLPREK